MNKFKELGINESILKVLEKKGFTEPTYIQEKSIPLILDGKDVVGQSATGSGKTLAFGTGLIENIERKHGLKGLVLTPTRELAEQVCEALMEFSAEKQLNIIPVYGGVSINVQISKLRKANIVVATPGRLLDHLERETIDLRNVEYLVLDEADRMVDMGFIDDVRKIISQCPEERQTMLFSATMSDDIQRIEHNFMDEPITVRVKSHVDPAKLKQQYYDVKQHNKLSLLITLLHNEVSDSVLIFCNTRRMVDMLSKSLYKNNIKSEAIHGGFTQAKRSKALELFQKKKVSVLVCTDVAARGLDIKGVSHVYNYDIPKDPKDYIHRIGRTARAGKEGKAVNILSPRDHENFGRVLHEYRQINVEKMEVSDVKLVEIKVVEHKAQGRFGGNNRGRGGPRRNQGRNPRGPQKRNNSRDGNSSEGSNSEDRRREARSHLNQGGERSRGPKRSGSPTHRRRSQSRRR